MADGVRVTRTEEVIASFDAIAKLAVGGWNHNNHYHRYLLRHVPLRRGLALDVGCGTGEFSRVLSGRFDTVIGIDFSPEMINVANQTGGAAKNVEYMCRDFAETEFADGSFDCVVSIAALHHMNMSDTLERAARLLRPGGRLMILDILRATVFVDYLYASAGVNINFFGRRVRQEPKSRELKKAWADHGPLDHYSSASEICEVAGRLLPRYRFRRHLYFRYSLVWEKPS